MFSKHSPNGTTPHLDNRRLEECIFRYQAQGDLESLGEIIQLSRNRALTLIRFHKTTKYLSEDELLSDVNLKLLKAIHRFNLERGSGFCYLSHIVQSVLCTAATNARKKEQRQVELDKKLIGELAAKTEDPFTCDDIAHQIRSQARSTLSDAKERAAQRWLIDSFLSDGFASRRHHAPMPV
jgi:hypothetical protein